MSDEDVSQLLELMQLAMANARSLTEQQLRDICSASCILSAFTSEEQLVRL